MFSKKKFKITLPKIIVTNNKKQINDMPFIKNDPNINRGGRPKNTFGYSYNLRKLLTDFCEENALDFLNDIKKMRPGYAKAQAFTTLLQFVLPKLTESNSFIDVSSLPEEQIDEIIKKMINEEPKLPPSEL
jgi:hypothetical protein